jgi:2-iminobutanoate/2-iminopropanoate deaminase
MRILRPLALLFAIALLAAPAHAQDGRIKIEKFNHSEWTKGIFSEAVTVTNVGNAKFVYLAGVGAEDENGKRGDIRHHGNFLEQCKYAYDKIKRVLAHHDRRERARLPGNDRRGRRHRDRRGEVS